MTRALVALFVVGCAGTVPRVEHTNAAADADRMLELARRLDYRAPMDASARPSQRAAELLLHACREGDRRSCWRGLAVADEPDTARALAIAVGRNCLAADEPSCRALASDLRDKLRGSADARDLCAAGLAAACVAAADGSERRAWLQRACDLGDAGACFTLWSIDLDRTEAVVEFRRARVLERSIAECVRGFPHSCARISQLDPDATTRWLPQLRTEAGAGCRLGLLAECELLASFAAEPFLSAPRLEAFAARQACAARGTHCEQLVVLHQRSGRLPDPLALRDALEHHCQLGRDRASCSRLAAAYLANQLPEPIRGRGKQLANFLASVPRTAKL